ncbi:MAG: FecCD family ABC transporter permease [Inquilinaceae bacterium]
MAVLAVTTTALLVLSLSVGPAPITVAGALRDLVAGTDSTAALILAQIRLPRTLLALAVGASLGLAGAALQGLLRNPLAEPGVLGVSGAAGLGAVLVFYTGLAAAAPLALPAGGMAGALTAVTLLYLLAGRDASILTLVLAGVALNSLAGALTALALSLSPNPFAMAEIVFWLLGSLADRSLEHVALALPFMAIGWLLVMAGGPALDALTLGETTARSLGIALPRLRLQIVAGTALAVGAAVSVSGVIGFVGLIVPHLLRPLAGHRPSTLMPLSALGGAVLTAAADIAVRLWPGGQELKLGVLTALIGAPFFLWLVLRTRRGLT